MQIYNTISGSRAAESISLKLKFINLPLSMNFN